MIFKHYNTKILRNCLCLLTLISPIFFQCSHAESKLKRIVSSAHVVTYIVGENGQSQNWTLTPEAKPDVLEVRLINGKAQKVQFITPQETAEFTIEEGKPIDFIISQDGNECLTRIIGKPYTPPTTFELNFDSSFAKLAAQLIRDGSLDAASLERLESSPTSTAMINKLRLKNFDQLHAYFLMRSQSPQQRELAATVLTHLINDQSEKNSTLEAAVKSSLRAYLPADFVARINVHFVFGSRSGGFAFDSDDVYVDLGYFVNATTPELAESVTHEVFHRVQGLLKPPPTSFAHANYRLQGTFLVNRFLESLRHEGTASLFSHSQFPDTKDKNVMEQNEKNRKNGERIETIFTLFESLVFRLLSNPPKDFATYDRVYGMMFLDTFDANGYELGWYMASAIESKDGKAAIFQLLKQNPRQFILRYQSIAKADPKLIKFSDEFIEVLNTRIPEINV